MLQEQSNTIKFDPISNNQDLKKANRCPKVKNILLQEIKIGPFPKSFLHLQRFNKKLNMKDPKAIQLLDELIKSSEQNFDVANIATKLTEIRTFALKEEDPLVVKLLRLSKEYIEQNNEFDLVFEGPEEEENKFIYFLNLIKGSENKYNREELAEIRNLLMA